MRRFSSAAAVRRDLRSQEMDIDGLLRRRPDLALVDELAHTNASGSRHPKRYMDVEKLLEADIEVNATLSLQHLESLNDVVAKITPTWRRPNGAAGL
jgi:two-component system sensor histidine kinase KdpD